MSCLGGGGVDEVPDGLAVGQKFMHVAVTLLLTDSFSFLFFFL